MKQQIEVMIVVSVGPVMEYGQKGFRKRVMLARCADDAGDRPMIHPIEFQRDDCALLDGINPGDGVEVALRAVSREWQDKHYVSLVASGLSIAARATPEPAPESVDVTGGTAQDGETMPF